MPSISALKDKFLGSKYLTMIIGNMLPFEETLKILISSKILTSASTSWFNGNEFATGA